MACWRINLVSVEFKVANKDLLLKTLKKLDIRYSEWGNRISFSHQGYDLEINMETQQITSNKSAVDSINYLKREYTRSAVEAKAKANKWILRPVANSNKMRVVKY